MRKAVLTIGICLGACSGDTPSHTAAIAVASNFKPAAVALEAAFEDSSRCDVSLSYGSTGTLYAQIINGAPYDVFLAADQERPAKLFADGHSRHTPFPYAVGQVVVWSPKTDTPLETRLKNGDYRYLAFANPETAPYGRAAKQVMERLNLDTSEKTVIGENIGQAFAFVETGNAALGFIARSQYVSLPQAKRGSTWTPPGTLYDPIRQDAVLLQDHPCARDFITFLQSDIATDIMTKSGYQRP